MRAKIFLLADWTISYFGQQKEADRESGPETEDFVPLEGEETDAAKSENQVVTAPKRRGRPKNPPLPPGVKKGEEGFSYYHALVIA